MQNLSLQSLTDKFYLFFFLLNENVIISMRRVKAVVVSSAPGFYINYFRGKGAEEAPTHSTCVQTNELKPTGWEADTDLDMKGPDSDRARDI